MARSPQTNAEETAAQDRARLEAELNALRDELAQLAATFADTAASHGSAFAETLSAETERLKARGEAALSGLQDGAEQCLEDTRAYVRDNPLASLGLAALAGLIFGLLFGRR